MRKISKEYYEYIRSTAWKRLRNTVLVRDRNICQVCFSRLATQVHHKTYKRIFHEKPEDLISVCTRCHRIITRANRIVKAKNHKHI